MNATTKLALWFILGIASIAGYAAVVMDNGPWPFAGILLLLYGLAIYKCLTAGRRWQ